MSDGFAEIRQELASLRRETDQRHDDNVILANQRHQQIMDRFERTNGTIGKAHDRASALEAIVGYLRTEWTLIRQRYHEVLNQNQVQARQPPHENHSNVVKWADLKTMMTVILACISGTAITILWILHVVKVI